MSVINSTKPIIKTINGVKKNRLIITNFHHQPASLNCFNEENQKEEDPFENAIKENAKLEAKTNEKRLMLKLFELKLKNRLKEYRTLNSQLEEDCHLKIDKSTESKEFDRIKKKLIDSSTKSAALEINTDVHRQTKGVGSNAIKNLEIKLKRSLSMNSLPSSLLRSLKNDEKLTEKKSKQELKKRIISTRKIYSNNERELVKKNQLQQQEQIAVKKEKSRNKEKKQPSLEIHSVKAEEDKIKAFQDSAKLNQNYCSQPATAQIVSSQNIDRYINYLKQLLKDRAKQFKLEIPPLWLVFVSI